MRLQDTSCLPCRDNLEAHVCAHQGNHEQPCLVRAIEEPDDVEGDGEDPEEEKVREERRQERRGGGSEAEEREW